MTWALKNIGLLCIAAAICCICASIDGWRSDLRANTAQVTNAVACRAVEPSNALAMAIDDRMLERFNKVRK